MSTSELRTVARHRQSTRFLGLEKLIHPLRPGGQAYGRRPLRNWLSGDKSVSVNGRQEAEAKD